jgi:hypothetical protein
VYGGFGDATRVWFYARKRKGYEKNYGVVLFIKKIKKIKLRCRFGLSFGHSACYTNGHRKRLDFLD